jgi:FG-GAP-like repeat
MFNATAEANGNMQIGFDAAPGSDEGDLSGIQLQAETGSLFAPQMPLAVGIQPFSVAVGNFNGDGSPDLAVADRGGNSVRILLGNGNGTFAPQTPIAVGNAPDAIAVGDFNGDGKLDLAVANSYFGTNGGTVSVLLSNGNGTFAAPMTMAVGDDPLAIAVGDFNGDGKIDLAVANFDSGTISILLGNGNGTFAPQTTVPVGSYPSSIAVGDFNGDGKLDLAVASVRTGHMSVLLGNGNGTFAPPDDRARERLSEFHRRGRFQWRRQARPGRGKRVQCVQLCAEPSERHRGHPSGQRQRHLRPSDDRARGQ